MTRFIIVSIGLLGLVAGCADGAVEKPPEVTGPQAVSPSAARAAWLNTKRGCNQYQYAIESASFTGTHWKTTIVVVAERPTARSFEQWRYDTGSQAPMPTKIVDVQWTENAGQLGSHRDGAPAKTMETLYDDCERDVLTKDPSSNTVSFKAEARGVLRECWYVPNNCADDCSTGVVLTEFACKP